MHIVLGFLTVVGIVWAAISFSAWRSTHSVVALLFTAAGVALAVWAARSLWRRDSFAAAQFLLFCSVVPVLVGGLWALNTESTTAWTVVAIFAVPVIACGVYLYRERTRPEVLPNVLLQWVQPGGVCELDGLQFAAQLVPPSSPAGVYELHIAVQSCVDAQRVLTVSLSGPPASRLRYRSRGTATVGAGEVGVFALPLSPVAGAGAPGTLHFAPHVSGDPGARIRYWRAQPYQRRIDPALTALLLVGGHLAWGGGWSVNVPASTAAEAPSGELPPDRWEVKWQPDPGLLASTRIR